MSKTIVTDITIIGAGLTGLTLAFYLRKAGKKVIVVEKENRTGGVIQTISDNGFLYESGPNTGVLGTPELVMLFDDLKGRCKAEIADPQSKNRWILKKGKWVAIPSGLLSAVTTPLFTLKDKFRILGEPFRKAGNDPDESVADMVVRRMGKSFLDYAVDPFLAGVYAGDPQQLTTRFALPKLYNLEQKYHSFIKGSIKKSREPKSEIEKRTTRDVFSVNGGLQNLINALTESITEEFILLNCQQTIVNPTLLGFKTTVIKTSGDKVEIHSEKVVTTSAAPTLSSLLPFVAKEELKPVTELVYAKVVQVAVGFKNWTGRPIQAFGGLVPSAEHRKILGILFPSSIFKDRAPQTGTLLSVFIAGMRNPDLFSLSDDELKTIVLDEIQKTLYPKEPTPDLIKVFRYHYAIPQYTKTTAGRLEKIGQLENRYKGLILAGNIRDGIGMADRVKQARIIADQINR